MLNILQASTERGADLVSQVLAFARGTQGQRQVLQLQGLVTELAKMLQQKGSGRGLISICAAGGLGVTAIMEAA